MSLPRDATKAAKRKDLIGVIDVLRCSSNIIYALANGAKEVIATRTLAEAYRLHREHPSFLLAGGRKGVRLRGFDLGNSPLEFVRQRVCGKTLILTTTSGTAALTRSRKADWVLIGAFLNAGSVARKAMEIAQMQGIGVSLVLSGRKGHFSLEDSLCGGAIAEDLRRHEADLSDLSFGAMLAFKQAKDSMCETIMAGEQGKYLVDLGFEEDVRFCCQLDLYSIVPICKNGVIRLSE